MQTTLSEGHGPQNQAYDAVPLPISPFSCRLGLYITMQSGWQDTVAFFQADMCTGSGLSLEDASASTAGQTGYPICTDHA